MTETTNSYTLEPFPGGKPHRLAWPMARRMYISRSMTAHNNTIDRTGILFYLVEGKEFENMSFMMHRDEEEEIKTFKPPKNPNYLDYWNKKGDWHDSEMYKHDYDLWNKCEVALCSFTAKFLGSLDDVALGAAGPANTRCTMPLRDIFHNLDERFGTITSGELRAERNKLKLPILSLAKFDKHLENHATIHLLLEDNFIKICDNEKIFTLQDSLANFPQLDIAINTFEMNYKLKDETRTLQRFTTDIVEYIYNNN